MRVVLALFACVFAMSTAVQAAETGTERNDFWVVWERELPGLPDCEGENCAQSVFFGHYIDGMAGGQAHRFFSGLSRFASQPSHANIRMPRSPLCLGPQPDAIPDPTTLEKADKIDFLRGLSGVHVDLRGVRGPQSFKGSFGETAQAFLLRIFAEHKIPILTKEEAAALPGNPVLSMRYSQEVHGCRPWSVSLGLSQRLLLARMPELMKEGSTWSASARQDEANADFGEENAMEQVIIAFAQAWSEANNPNWVKPETN